MMDQIKNREQMTPQERKAAWDFAIGLNKIDGYEPSEEYLELVDQEIHGEITLEDIRQILFEKYLQKGSEENG